MDWFLGVILFAGGYIASIYTWSHIRAYASGATAEAAYLEQRAAELRNKL